MFVEKYEGALGKGKGKRLYAYRMLMAKVCGAEAASLWRACSASEGGLPSQARVPPHL